MIMARLAVYGSILCTLWFNGSYAWSKGGSEVQQYGMVAVAVTIDLCKCGFLTAASHLWRNTWFIPAIVLVLLWPLTFAYSVFSGFASITTNRSITSASSEGLAQQRTRYQAAYDQAAAALDLAKTSPLWTATSACTAAKTNKQRDFCDNIEITKNQQDAAAAPLNTMTPSKIDPEVTVLKDNTGLTMSTLLLIIAGAPALILELVSSLGLYAISRPPSVEASRKPARRTFRFRLPRLSRDHKTEAALALEASEVPSKATQSSQVEKSGETNWKW
jgi:hypothetical protein